MVLVPNGAVAERHVTALVLAQEDADGNVQWFLTDHEGSVRDVVGLVSGNWQVVSHITYTSFGVATASGAMPRFAFAGRELDPETQLYYNRMRYYDAATGRFLSEDPSGFGGGDGNLYRYVSNSPTDATDPSGISEHPPIYVLVPDGGGECGPADYAENSRSRHEWDGRNPDYISLNVSVAVPTPWTGTALGWNGTLSIDCYGQLYASPLGVTGGKSLTFLSASLTVNWLEQLEKPSSEQLCSFLTEHGFSFGAGVVGGVSTSYTPGSGWAVGSGLFTPQIGVSYNYSWQLGPFGVPEPGPASGTPDGPRNLGISGNPKG